MGEAARGDAPQQQPMDPAPGPPCLRRLGLRGAQRTAPELEEQQIGDEQGERAGGGNGDLMSIAASWLGKGENAPISGGQLTQMLGSDKIAAFAQQLGLSQEQAVSGLQAAIPQVVDKASPDGALDLGNMLDAVGGVSGAIGLASKLFGR